MRAVLVGILSSLFFSATFIINRAMNLGGTSWAWGLKIIWACLQQLNQHNRER